MADQKLSDEEFIRLSIEATARGSSIPKFAAEIGLNVRSVQRRRETLKKNGTELPPLCGHELAEFNKPKHERKDTKPRRHFIIPDTQVKPGDPTDHMEWIGRAIGDYKPDVVIHLGDHWDFPSLSRWSEKGSAEMEGRRYEDDLRAGNDALKKLTEAMGKWNGRKVLLRGNHEHRLDRAISSDVKWAGAIGEHQFCDVSLGWEVVPYFMGSPQAIVIDGISYAHYFANPNTGKAIGGTITNRLAKIGTSFVQGHQQGLLQGNVQYATGVIRHGISAGSAYLHDEEYKGMSNAHWRGVVVLNEVRDGTFCEMPLTLTYLCRKYTGMGAGRWLRENYENAEHRFSLARAA